MGRTITITVHSARDLRNADAEEGGQSDPYVIVCFDNKLDQELGRTPTIEDSASPQWDHTLDVDITPHIQSAVDDGKEEPESITFCVYDGDAGESEPLGVAAVAFKDVVATGSFEGEVPVYLGEGFVTVSIQLKKVKKSSMLTDDATLKIAGGVVGVAAAGLVGAYLFQRHKKKQDKLEDTEREEGAEQAEDAPEEGSIYRTGMEYGYHQDDDDDDEEDKGTIKKWWEMDDEASDDDDENRWGYEG